MQRVNLAKVIVNNQTIGAIARGLLVYIGLEKSDAQKEPVQLMQKVADKLLRYRVFADESGKLNDSLQDLVIQNKAGGDKIGLLIVSQFTLAAYTDKGRRPDFGGAMPPDLAKNSYDLLLKTLAAACEKSGIVLQSGEFGADMQVISENDGPINFLLQL